MQMLLERGVSAGVQHIRLQQVLRRAGLTTGAAYRLWADQTDYQRDLAVAMVKQRFMHPAAIARAAVAELIENKSDPELVIRAAAATHVDPPPSDGARPAALDDQAFLVALALRTAASTWPELAEASRARHEDSLRDYAELYQLLMDTYGLRMKRPLTIMDFTDAMAALGEGFAVRRLEGIPHRRVHTTIDGDDEVPAGEWSLFAIGVRALVNEMMTPIDPVAHGSTVALPNR